MSENLLWIFQIGVPLFASITGWPVVLLALRASARRHEPAPSGKAKSSGKGVPATTLRGGLWIGFIERFAVAGAVLMGQFPLIAVVVAVKGLGRFKELVTPEASEKFVLGTLVSMTWAVLIAAIAQATVLA